MDKKYELTGNTKEVDGHILHQIKALKSFDGVRKGDLGGWIEDYSNLAQTDTSWVYDDAMVYENAKVYDDAKVRDSSQIYGDVEVVNSVLVLVTFVLEVQVYSSNG